MNKVTNISPVYFISKKLKYICCGKVNIMRNNKNIIGYVLYEDQENFKVLLTNDQTVMVKKPKIMSLVGDNEKIKSVYYQYENNEEKIENR